MRISLLILFLLAAVVAAPAQTIDKTKAPTIQVTGSAEINVVPDEVNISLKVSKVNKELIAAKTANDDEIAKIVVLTNNFGVAPMDVKTDYISVNEKYERRLEPGTDDEYTNVFVGYNVSRTITIKLRDINKFENFLTEAVKVGVANISNVSFETSELRKYKDKARANAIKAAREKADAITGEIGQSIGKAISIVENDIDGYRSPYSNYRSNAFETDGAELGTAAIGTISVKAQVEVEFILN